MDEDDATAQQVSPCADASSCEHLIIWRLTELLVEKLHDEISKLNQASMILHLP